ncbi:MAG: TIGR02757 family protein [Bacteroidetes bacterium]|nr:TIGR02757 family protein [Bacteroidota bacterium]MCB0803885.1 TIGR02757 family protein [Flavobacteriales bacterium]NOG58209.1 TIGR02757 family protein [Bacteroidota bacterium]
MKIKQSSELQKLLDEKAAQYESLEFINDDPIQIPHLFSKKEDIEIAGFFAATLAWGQRVTIIRNAKKILTFMDHEPHDFILNHNASDLKSLPHFVHRTFNSDDLVGFFHALQHIYKNHGGLEAAFRSKPKLGIQENLALFKQLFFETDHLVRTEKHISNPIKKSSAKRINMYLRWMVRNNAQGVDFGIWNNYKAAELMIPLDVHTGAVGRKLGLLERKQNDWQAVEELTNNLRKYDANDPVKYDFALFGMGVNKDVED